MNYFLLTIAVLASLFIFFACTHSPSLPTVDGTAKTECVINGNNSRGSPFISDQCSPPNAPF